MTNFYYEGRNAEGSLVTGNIEAQSAENAADQLVAQQIIPLKISAATATSNVTQKTSFDWFQSKVKSTELLVFCQQMYSLIKAGIPITAAIERLSEILTNPKIKEALKGIQKQLSAGENLSTAMQRYPRVFTSLLLGLVAAGEANGRLDQAFLQGAKHYELETSTKRRINSAFRYPLLVVVFAFAAIFVINIFVIPKFALLFANFHATLPLPTRILINFSSFIKSYWYIILIALLIIIIFIHYRLKNPAFKQRWDYYKLKIPIIGKILERIIMTNFSRSLAMLLQTGVPIIQSLTLVASVANNAYAKEKILAIRNLVERGETLSQAATESGLFPSLILQMLAVGDQTGNTDKMLLEVSELYEREVDYDIKQLAEKIEPILLIIVSAVVLLLALGVFLPMWDMVNIVR